MTMMIKRINDLRTIILSSSTIIAGGRSLSAKWVASQSTSQFKVAPAGVGAGAQSSRGLPFTRRRDAAQGAHRESETDTNAPRS